MEKEKEANGLKKATSTKMKKLKDKRTKGESLVSFTPFPFWLFSTGLGQ